MHFVHLFIHSFIYLNINSGYEVEDSLKSKPNQCPDCTSQEPNGEKTRKEVSVLNVRGKLQRIISGKTHAV